MPEPTRHSSPATTTQLWAIIADRLEAFGRAWEADGPPPDLGAFLLPGPPEVRQLLLVELIKFDLDTRLQRSLDRPLEDYIREFPELIAPAPPADLLYEDYHLRRRAGRPADPHDYFSRFPARADELARLLGGTALARSTSVLAARIAIAVQPGDRLDDFDLLALVGEGQFARVFLARQRTLQRLVALKVSAARGAEAQTLAQLDHAHIVRVYDQRVLVERGLQLVYMPYLPGGTLQDVLVQVRNVPPEERSGRLLLDAIDAVLVRRGEVPPAAGRRHWAERDWPATVCAIGAKLAAALDYAHRNGVLHRDLKPANVLLAADGEPLLADFNVGFCSKLDGAEPAALFGGSLGYMAPEHLEAFDPAHARPPESLDGRADMFGLAVTLWELATGKRPFGVERVLPDRRETLAGLVAQRRAGPTPEAVAAFSDGSVPGVRDVLLRCLEADADRRPATAGELARELELCLRPETRELLRPAPGGWREVVRRHPLLTAYPLGVVPNLLASAFNIAYNRAEIISKWTDAKDVFDRVILAVNGFFFPFAMVLFWLAFRPVSRGLRCVRAGAWPDPDDLARQRRRCLRLGALTAGVCAGCWALAGLLWPVILRSAAGAPPQGPEAYVHFLLSLLVCGLVAAAYPYFLVSYVAVRVLYPALLGPTGPDPSDGAALRRVERELGWYRAAATAVPLLAVAVLAFRGASNQPAVAVLSVAGLAGVILALALEGRTRAALTALADLPAGEPNP